MHDIGSEMAEDALYLQARHADRKLAVGHCRHLVYAEARIFGRRVGGWADDDGFMAVASEVVEHLADAVGDSVDGGQKTLGDDSNPHECNGRKCALIGGELGAYRSWLGEGYKVGCMSASTDLLDRFYSVIPAGGIGSRLWPLSRADAPKFLHDLSGSGQSLLRDTWDRLAPLAGEQRIMVVTGRAHRAAAEEPLPNLQDHNVVLESEPRDSTAAIGLAAAILERREPGAIIGSFAADHVITN